jgi:hypothetical protein
MRKELDVPRVYQACVQKPQVFKFDSPVNDLNISTSLSEKHVILFGSKESRKNELLSLTQDTSLVSQVIKAQPQGDKSSSLTLYSLGETHQIFTKKYGSLP